MQRNVKHITAGLRLLLNEAEAGRIHDDETGFKIEMTPDEIRELTSHFERITDLVETGFRARADMQGYRGDRRIDAQADFLAGAMSVLNEVPPSWYFACIRGELL